MDPPDSAGLQKVGLRRRLCRDNHRQDTIRDWLSSNVDVEDAKREAASERAVPMRRSPSEEDDLALGVEASVYGRPGVQTVQEFLRSTRSSPTFSRWNSFNSVGTSHSAPLSVMDVLNMWMDDPEELLLDLGFGCDEPDISDRIPARFINAPSQARGINIQVFLEAQKSRLDLENPDVSNRFRQLEVLHQVTTAFTALVGSGPPKAHGSVQVKTLPAEAQERRRRVGLLLRRASKMSLNLEAGGNAGEGAPAAALKGDKKALSLKRPAALSPLAEEQGPQDPLLPQVPGAFQPQDGALRLEPLKEDQPLDTSGPPRKRSSGKSRESFEMEEIQSFDEGSVVSGMTGGPENMVWGLVRTNSTQSDSSGFLEEPFVPSLDPGPELIKTLAVLSGDTPPPSPTTLPPHHISPAPSSLPSPSILPPHPLTEAPSHTAAPPPPACLPSSPDPPADRASPNLTPSPPNLTPTPGLRPPGESSVSPARQRSAVSAMRPDDETTNDPVLEGLGSPGLPVSPGPPGSPVRHVVPGRTDPMAGGPECGSLGPHSSSGGGVEQSGERPRDTVQDTAGVRPGDAFRTGSGRYPPFGGAEITQMKAGSLPLMVETDIDAAEMSFPGSGGLPQGTGTDADAKHGVGERPGRSGHHLVETNLDEVGRASWTLAGAPAGESEARDPAPRGRYGGLLETDLDELESTDFATHFETLAVEGKQSRRLQEVLETDIDAVESAEPSEGGAAGSDPPGGVLGLLETHIDDPDLAVYTGGGGVTLTYRLTGPIAVASLDEVFETSLDGSSPDSELGDVDAICLELGSDGLVYWAEPVRVASTSPALSQSDRGTPSSPAGPVALDSSSFYTPDRLKTLPSGDADAPVGVETASPPPASPPPAPRRRCGSVSVQMPSCPSSRSVSHIVRRKDVPYAPAAAPPRPSLMSASLPCLDTSTPLRAVQSWTDLQLRRRGLNGTAWGGLLVSQSQGSLRVEASATALRPATASSSDPALRTASASRWSTDSLPGSPSSLRSTSVSLDTGLWAEDEDEDSREGRGRLEEHLWEGSEEGHQACCCSCERHHTCGATRLRRAHSTQSVPYSQDELESMIFSLRRFRVVLADIEEQVSDDQASVFTALSAPVREEVCDITELRRKVKQEAGELELQLKELTHHYDDNFQMKMQRLLNEQTLLCSQLRLLPPPGITLPVGGATTPVRSVSTQCSLSPAPKQQGNPLPSPGGPALDSPMLDCTTTKPDKLDFVGFLQRLKDSLRPSVNAESLE
ncbi:unnamed protein product [Gadus morhua 'NCC']